MWPTYFSMKQPNPSSWCIVEYSILHGKIVKWGSSWVKWVRIRCMWIFHIYWEKECRQNFPLHRRRVSRFLIFFFFFLHDESPRCRVTHDVFILEGTSHVFGTLFLCYVWKMKINPNGHTLFPLAVFLCVGGYSCKTAGVHFCDF